MFSLAKIAMSYSPPVFLTGVRMAVAGLILLGYIYFRQRGSFKLNRKQVFSLILLSFFSIYLTNVLEFWGLQFLTSSKTCFIYSLSPFFAAFLSYLHFGERMTNRKWIGLLIGLLGIIPVLTIQTGGEDLLSAVGFLSWPALAVAGAAFCSVYGWVLLRLLVKDQSVTPMMANGSSMLFGGALALVHSLFIDTWNPLPVATSNILPFMGWVMVMVFISNIVCYNLYGYMLKKYTATFLSFFGLLSPLFASLHGLIFLGEPISWTIILSTGIVATGLWIVYGEELRQGYIISKAKPEVEAT
jgi:drug/metabolite transporter (DMT)-like permease